VCEILQGKEKGAEGTSRNRKDSLPMTGKKKAGSKQKGRRKAKDGELADTEGSAPALTAMQLRCQAPLSPNAASPPYAAWVGDPTVPSPYPTGFRIQRGMDSQGDRTAHAYTCHAYI
jgi:hypothetical protein